MQHVASVEKFDLAAWNRVLSLNLTAGFLLSKALLPAMLTKVGAWGQLWATAVRVLAMGVECQVYLAGPADG
jgi:NAD(P)-dependent dehydrogenase (short-subunit alcohol dehydrogenase family)